MSSLDTLFSNCSIELRRGRSVAEGYRRGVGLKYGNLKSIVAQDPDYQDAVRFAHGRSIVTGIRLMNLFLLLKYSLPRLPFGHVIEYGSYRGGSAMFMARLAQKFLPGSRVYALDSFKGMPRINLDIDHHHEGDFKDTNPGAIRADALANGLTNLNVVEGFFEDTAPAVLREAGTIRLAHIDCDIYDAVKYSYDLTKRYMVPGGYSVSDDATAASCLGTIEELVIGRDRLFSEQIDPHFIFRHFPDEAKPTL